MIFLDYVLKLLLSNEKIRCIIFQILENNCEFISHNWEKYGI
jgi:hypothetical protein